MAKRNRSGNVLIPPTAAERSSELADTESSALSATHPYDALTPEIILDAAETFGLRCTGALLALNSYENRVYRIDVEDSDPVVAKFYRPGRWSDAAILEEHAFTRMLADHEIPAVAPLAHSDGPTLREHAGFRFALFPWARGRTPELNTDADKKLLGRYMGRLHRLGQAARFEHRARLSVAEFGEQSVALLKRSGFVPSELRGSYFGAADTLLPLLTQVFSECDGVAWIRLHGDCHLGNVLWNDGPILVDFDDSLAGPAVQDLWMLLSGERDEMQGQLTDYLDGYTEFMDFDATQLRLVEPLRTLRLLRYAGWLAARWDDPAFPRTFPWFTTPRYWEEQVLALKQQLALLEEAPLTWSP
jgi:Ser/Thr protein kinase RdoA (MazF antagonist)